MTGNGNGSAPTHGELQRWLQRVDRDTQHQWGEVRRMGQALVRLETKVDTLIEKRSGVGAGEAGDARPQEVHARFERMYGAWRLIGHALAVAIPAAILTASVVITWLEFSQ